MFNSRHLLIRIASPVIFAICVIFSGCDSGSSAPADATPSKPNPAASGAQGGRQAGKSIKTLGGRQQGAPSK